METFSHPDEQVQTMYVDRGHGPVRINASDFDPATDKIDPRSHFVPEGVEAPKAKAPTKAELADAKAKADAEAEVAAKLAAEAAAKPVTAPVVPGQAFTMPDGNGKFFRTDANGVHLIAEPFDTPELAAAAIIPA